MPCPPGEPVHQPGVDGPEIHLPRLGLSTQPVDVIQHPAELRGAEVGVEHQPGRLSDPCLLAALLQLGAHLCRPAVLPDDGPGQGLPSGAVPHRRRLPLVGDADGGHHVGADVRVGKALLAAPLDRLPDLPEVVLHPAGAGKVLGELAVCLADHLELVVDDEDVRAGRALIDCEEIAPLGHGARQGSGSPVSLGARTSDGGPPPSPWRVQRTAAGPNVRSTNPVTSAATSSRFRSLGRMCALSSMRT